MSIITIHLPFSKEYVKMIQDIYKLLIIFIIFNILLFMSKLSKNDIASSLTGSILNDNYMLLVIYLVIGVMSYYLVFEKILKLV